MNEVVPEVMTIFRETDKRVSIRALAERNELIRGVVDTEDSQEAEASIVYRCQTHDVIDRLNIMGFTLRRAREDFEALRKSEVEELAEDMDWFRDEREFLRELTFDKYISALREVMTRQLRPYPFSDRDSESLSPVVKYILGESDDRLLGYFCSDVRSLLRVACELAGPNTYVVQDITELVSAGYFGEGDSVCLNTIRLLTAGYPENSPRLILTEGSTDSGLLRDAMDLLYPHLSPYYSFLDFASTNSPGGAGHLVRIVQAFAAAGIANRVIALFDNDTAARDATRALYSIQLPPNIAVLHYPDIELLRHYPTQGPSGLSHLDVNGLAGTIELYLGADALTVDGALVPVQWRGYNEALKKYQGEVMWKNQIHDAFQSKVRRCRADAEAMLVADWVGVRSILGAVFQAFQ